MVHDDLVHGGGGDLEPRPPVPGAVAAVGVPGVGGAVEALGDDGPLDQLAQGPGSALGERQASVLCR